MDAWQQILKFVESKINRQNFITWFKPTQFQSLDDDNNLFVKVPNQVFENWLSNHYCDLLREAIEHSNLGNIKICFHTERNSQPKKDPLQPATPYQTTLNFDSVEYLLNPKYTFDRFVVASCNQFAHAAALAVAESPSKAYNPLFIYGAVGLGKTHLMQAVGHMIKEKDRRARLSYVSSEKFTNEVVNAIRYDRTLALREKYRSVDVLLIDDIQFISGKEATQEEFFHTFNALYDAQKQIVLSSDSLPKEIPSIQERLQSRFESGLIADIQPPDLETKVAILKKKAESENFEIPFTTTFSFGFNLDYKYTKIKWEPVDDIRIPVEHYRFIRIRNALFFPQFRFPTSFVVSGAWLHRYWPSPRRCSKCWVAVFGC